MKREAPLSVHVHGPNVTEDAAREAGEATARLLDAVGESLGHPALGWKVGSVRFACDGCDRRQPFDQLRDGWTHVGGDDFCPACSAEAA